MFLLSLQYLFSLKKDFDKTIEIEKSLKNNLGYTKVLRLILCV
jgi:hypothetical protein